MSEGLTRRSPPPEEDVTSHVKQGSVVAAEASSATPPSRPLRPRACRLYIRRQVAAEWSAIVDTLLKGARQGSVSHINLAAKLAGFDFRAEVQQKWKPREESFARQLLEEIDELEKKNIAEFGPL